MTVAELIEALRQMDPEREVRIGYDYRDRQHTTVTGAIHNVEEVRVRYSDYHQNFVAPDFQNGEQDDPDEIGERRDIVVLA